MNKDTHTVTHLCKESVNQFSKQCKPLPPFCEIQLLVCLKKRTCNNV